MLFVRMHLDRQDEDDGAMEIALGSHRHGLVPASEAAALAESLPREVTVAEPGDVLVLAMLTLHRSRPSRSGAPRRTLRIDLAEGPAPPPLRWAG